MPLLLNLLAKNSGSWPNSWVAAWLHMMSRCFGWGPRHTWNGSQFYKVFGNIHMLFLWMGRWIHHHVTTTILVGPEFSNFPKSWVSAFGYKWCHDGFVETPDPHGMASTSTPNTYKAFVNIHVLWMGTRIYPPSCQYRHTCWPRFQRIVRILGSQLVYKWSQQVHWLRPQTHMECFPHPLLTYTRCLRTFIWCCGEADDSQWCHYTSTILVCKDFSELGKILGSNLGYK
jgi:hypothetical protein